MKDIVAIAGFFTTVIVVTLGFPLVRSWTKRKEMERISESQRFDQP